MSFKGAKFGFGPKELGGSVDLISHYRLQSHHEHFCKRSIPLSVSETHYLRNVVGDREIRKGDGMELEQLSKNHSQIEKRHERVHTFRLEVLADALHMRETATARLPTPDRGIPTDVTKLERKSKDSRHKKNKGKHTLKAKDPKVLTHQSKGMDDDGVKDKKRNGPLLNGQDPMKHQEKKRKHFETGSSEYPPRAQRQQKRGLEVGTSNLR